MYRILIAEDEQDERIVIRYVLNKYNFELDVLEAANGKEALAILAKTPVQILFTDIKMPFFNGIEVAAKARELYPNLQIIFFSGYDDFEYVKKALSLRAVNYILKPVNPEEFQKTIASVIETIQAEEIELNKQKASTGFMKNHILYQLINNYSLENSKKMYPELDDRFVSAFHRMFLIQFDMDFFGSEITGSDTDTFWQHITDLLPVDSYFINLNPSQSLILLTEQKKSHQWFYDLAELLQHSIATRYQQNCFISISSSFTAPKGFAKAYEEAENFLEDRFFYSNNYIYSEQNNNINHEVILENDDLILKSIERDIGLRDTYSLKQNVQILLQKYENKAAFSHIYVRYLFTNLLKLLLQNLPQYDETAFLQIAERIYNFKHFSDIHSLISETMAAILAILENETQSPKHVIHLVEQYILKHYSEELSLDILAEKVFLTPRYLSSIFIQENGCGINKYIKNIRMEKAKDLLLHTNMKINDICKAVGYSNVSYFIKSFQENFGTTPDKFRQNPSPL